MFSPDISFWQTAQAIALGLGAIPTPTNLKLLAAWSYCEKPHYAGGSWQWNNPLNTELACCGWTGNGNSAGVKVYPTPSAGIQATVTTLRNGYYSQIVHALVASNASQFFNAASEVAKWGSSPSCVQSDYQTLVEPPSEFLSMPVAVSTAPVVSSSAATVSWGYLILGLTGVALGTGALVLAVSPRTWHEFTQWEQEDVRTMIRRRAYTRY